MPISSANESKLLNDQMSNSQAYNFILNIFLCSEYIINIKRNTTYLLGDSHSAWNRWKSYFCQLSPFCGIKEVKETEPLGAGDRFRDTGTDV
jgi:hypothetical protein